MTEQTPKTILSLPPELRQSILLQANSITTYPPFPRHPSTHPLGLSFFEIHAYYYIHNSLKQVAILRQVFDPHNDDMDFVQETWARELISVAKEAEWGNRENQDRDMVREVGMVGGIEMEVGLAEIVGSLVAKGRNGGQE